MVASIVTIIIRLDLRRSGQIVNIILISQSNIGTDRHMQANKQVQ